MWVICITSSAFKIKCVKGRRIVRELIKPRKQMVQR